MHILEWFKALFGGFTKRRVYHTCIRGPRENLYYYAYTTWNTNMALSVLSNVLSFLYMQEKKEEKEYSNEYEG